MPAPCQFVDAGQQRQLSQSDLGRQLRCAGDFEQVAEQAKAGDVGHRVHARGIGQVGTRGVELGRGGDHRCVLVGAEQALFQRRAVDPHAQRLAQDEAITGLAAAVLLDLARVHHADANQAIDRFRRIDGVAARDRDPGRLAHRFATGEDLADDVVGQLADRHADDGQREQRTPAHGIDVGQRIGCGDAAEFEGIVYDRHEKISGRHDRLFVVQPVDSGIVAVLDSHQQVGIGRRQIRGKGRVGQDVAQHRWGDLAPTAAAVGELGQPDGVVGSRCAHGPISPSRVGA